MTLAVSTTKTLPSEICPSLPPKQTMPPRENANASVGPLLPPSRRHSGSKWVAPPAATFASVHYARALSCRPDETNLHPFRPLLPFLHSKSALAVHTNSIIHSSLQGGPSAFKATCAYISTLLDAH